jgi:hypothetical protein
LELAHELKEQGISYIGTIRHNNRGVPPDARSTKGRTRKDTKVYYDGNRAVLVSFWDKITKPVLLIDTLHRVVPIPSVNQKPTTVLLYNRTKSGVDTFDKRVKGFSCKRKCRRWPYAIFSNLIDISTNNGCIIFTQRGHSAVRQHECHYDFLKNAAYQLVDNQIKRRIQSERLNFKIKHAMELLGYEVNSIVNEELEPLKLQKNKPCAFCQAEKDRKTSWG